ncbi:hypothetical protein LTS18_005997 [Coniosporium uncinatum]|uniref:Uncharacterized protein n=1 Tax=Coniosporium uncinatum TaxID=93489 RepID=A0ACC3DCT6_9PEZI|nr:hypothetical protein LTS18_005997 [Coniosporium uncinatum]
MGVMLLGSSPSIAQARQIRKSIGGGMRQAGVLSAAVGTAVEEQFGHGEWDDGGKLRAVHRMAKTVGKMWTAKGDMLMNPIETNQVWLDLNSIGIEPAQWADYAEGQANVDEGTRGPRAPNQRRNGAALREFYGLNSAAPVDATSGTQGESVEKEDGELSELDREGFDAEEYVRDVLESEGLEGVLRVESRLINGQCGQNAAIVRKC